MYDAPHALPRGSASPFANVLRAGCNQARGGWHPQASPERGAATPSQCAYSGEEAALIVSDADDILFDAASAAHAAAGLFRPPHILFRKIWRV
jgi:hypothetical protein